jgi:hypothetical protein
MKKMNTIQVALVVMLTTTLFTFSSCERKYDKPPVTEIPVGNVIDIATLKGMYAGSNISIQEDYSVYATVTADESTGNFYKEAYVQDATGAIKLRLVSPGGLYIGDSIRIYLKGTILSTYNGLLQLDSVNVDNNVIKQAVGKYITPTVYGLDQISAGLQSQLVRIENVEFVANELGTTWANAITQFAVNHNVTDCNGNTRLLRTSGYSNFAGEVIPNGNGYLTAIVGVFNNDVQLYIRTPNEVVFNDPRCTGGGPISCDPINGLSETFTNHTANGTVSELCWKSFSTVGTRNWLIKEVSGNKIAEASILGTGDNSNEMWMITPEIQSSGNDILSFQSAVQNWNHDGVSVWVSTNFNGTSVGSANWTQLTATIAGNGDGNNVYVSSGGINLASVLGAAYTGTYYIGFKYNASGIGGQTSTYRIDNVLISQ